MAPLAFELISGDPRPELRMTHRETGEVWLV